MAGLKVSPAQQRQLEALVDALPDLVRTVKQALGSHAVQNGLLSRPVKPHDPLKLPFRHVCADGCKHDFVELLGKPVTRGSLRNIGADELTVRITGANGQVSEFPLTPGQVEETSSYVYNTLEVIGDGARLSVSAQ